METTNVFDAWNDRETEVGHLEVVRLGDDMKKWLFVVEDSYNTTQITLDRKQLKDLIEALENERYSSDRKNGGK
jgi:hypothetical protein